MNLSFTTHLLWPMLSVISFWPHAFPVSAFVIASESMEPNVQKGSLVFVSRQPSYERGDVVTYRIDGTTATHRITAKEQTIAGSRYITKGDRNPSPDPEPVPHFQIIGKVFMEIPVLGYIRLGLRTVS